MKRTSALMLCALLFAAHAAMSADNYPDKALRFMVPFPPGGGTDGLARILGAKLTDYWGYPVIIDNRGGAQGNIGTAAGAKSAPDGYTLTLAHSGSMAINPHLYKDTGFDTLKDFAAVSSGVVMPFILVVHPSLPVKSVGDLVKLAKAKPGAINYSSGGVGTPTFIAGELFKLQAGVNLMHVPYRAGGEALTAVLAGETSVYFAPIAPAFATAIDRLTGHAPAMGASRMGTCRP